MQSEGEDNIHDNEYADSQSERGKQSMLSLKNDQQFNQNQTNSQEIKTILNSEIPQSDIHQKKDNEKPSEPTSLWTQNQMNNQDNNTKNQNNPKNLWFPENSSNISQDKQNEQFNNNQDILDVPDQEIQVKQNNEGISQPLQTDTITNTFQPTKSQIQGDVQQKSQKQESQIISEEIKHQNRQQYNQKRTDQATLQQQINQFFEPSQILSNNINPKHEDNQKQRQQSQQGDKQHILENTLNIPQGESLQIKSEGMNPSHLHQQNHNREQQSNFDNKGDNDNLNDKEISQMNQIDQTKIKKVHSNVDQFEKQKYEKKFKDDIQVAQDYKNGLFLDEGIVQIKKNQNIQEKKSQQQIQEEENSKINEDKVKNLGYQPPKQQSVEQKQTHEIIQNSNANLHFSQKQQKASWKNERNQSISSEGQKRIVQVQKQDVSPRRDESVYSNRMMVQSVRIKPQVQQKPGNTDLKCKCIIM